MKKTEGLENILYFLIRLMAIISAVIILGLNIMLLLREYRYDKIFSRLIFGYRFISTIMTEIFLIVLIIFPYKFEAIAVFAFFYTGVLLYADPLNPLSVLIYFLGIVSLYIRGLLKKKRMLKSILISSGVIVILFSNIRYGWFFFLEDFENKIICCIVCVLIFIFIVLEKNKLKQNKCLLDLSLFPELTQRDKEWIEMALSQEKYDTIARQYNLSPNYVKNRMRVIFKVLGVPDRLALIAKYSGCSVKK
jgi:DNA-binding CsgD family transcriptional regulator/uncharacterized membrane protein